MIDPKKYQSQHHFKYGTALDISQLEQKEREEKERAEQAKMLGERMDSEIKKKNFHEARKSIIESKPAKEPTRILSQTELDQKSKDILSFIKDPSQFPAK